MALTKKRSVAPISKPAAALPAGFDPNGLPLPAGSVTMAPSSRAMLEQLGWKDGDPIPGDIGEKIQAMQREIAAMPLDPGVDPKRAPIPLPQPVPIDKLPPEKQAELQQALADAKTQFAQLSATRKRSAVPLGAAPSVAAAIEHAAQVAQAQQQPQTTEIEFVDDLPKPAEPEPAAAPSATGATLTQTHCPRCGWDQRVAFDIEPSQEDVTNYITAIFGARFEKTLTMMQGRLAVRFRTLRTKEVDTIFEQLALDAKADQFATNADAVVREFDYRLCACLAEVRFDGAPQGVVHPIGDYEAPEGQTVLPELREHINTEVLANEASRRMVNQLFVQFRRIVDKLELKTSQPDF